MVKIEIAKPEKAETLRAEYLMDKISTLCEAMNNSLQNLMVSNKTIKNEYSLEKGMWVFRWALDSALLHLAESFQSAGWVAKVEYKEERFYPEDEEMYCKVSMTLSSSRNSGPYR